MSTMLAKAEWHVRCLLKRSLTRDIKCVADEILPGGHRFWFLLNDRIKCVLNIEPKKQVHLWINDKCLAVVPIHDIGGIDYYDHERLKAEYC